MLWAYVSQHNYVQFVWGISVIDFKYWGCCSLVFDSFLHEKERMIKGIPFLKIYGKPVIDVLICTMSCCFHALGFKGKLESYTFTCP